PFVDTRFGDDQVRHVGRSLILGVAQGALQHLLEQTRAAMRHVLQQVERLVGVLVANQVRDQTHLLGADACISMTGFVGHKSDSCVVGFLSVVRRQLSVATNDRPLTTDYLGSAFFTPPWPRKVRVGANSPSLCPTMSSVTKTFMWALPLWTMNV